MICILLLYKKNIFEEYYIITLKEVSIHNRYSDRICVVDDKNQINKFHSHSQDFFLLNFLLLKLK